MAKSVLPRRQSDETGLQMRLIGKGVHFAVTWMLQTHLDIKCVLVPQLFVTHLCTMQLLTLRN